MIKINSIDNDVPGNIKYKKRLGCEKKFQVKTVISDRAYVHSDPRYRKIIEYI